MKKNLLLASLLVFGATSLFATEVEHSAFVGLEVGSTSYDFKVEAPSISYSYSKSYSDNSQSLKLGKYLGDFGRAYGTIGRVDADDATVITYGLGYDYLVYNSSDFTPFIGATLGYQQVDLDDASIVELSGLTYGVEIGAQYSINESFDIEVGYRMNFDSSDDTITVSGRSIKYTLDNTKIWYIGANYSF